MAFVLLTHNGNAVKVNNSFIREVEQFTLTVSTDSHCHVDQTTYVVRKGTVVPLSPSFDSYYRLDKLTSYGQCVVNGYNITVNGNCSVYISSKQNIITVTGTAFSDYPYNWSTLKSTYNLQSSIYLITTDSRYAQTITSTTKAQSSSSPSYSSSISNVFVPPTNAENYTLTLNLNLRITKNDSKMSYTDNYLTVNDSNLINLGEWPMPSALDTYQYISDTLSITNKGYIGFKFNWKHTTSINQGSFNIYTADTTWTATWSEP